VTEWICGTHWRQTDRIKRLHFAQLKRQARGHGKHQPGTGQWDKAWAVWEEIKDEAVERAAGIT